MGGVSRHVISCVTDIIRRPPFLLLFWPSRQRHQSAENLSLRPQNVFPKSRETTYGHRCCQAVSFYTIYCFKCRAIDRRLTVQSKAILDFARTGSFALQLFHYGDLWFKQRCCTACLSVSSFINPIFDRCLVLIKEFFVTISCSYNNGYNDLRF